MTLFVMVGPDEESVIKLADMPPPKWPRLPEIVLFVTIGAPPCPVALWSGEAVKTTL